MTNIYVVSHKPFHLSGLGLDSCYRLLRVGSYGLEPIPEASDRNGDNIANKNPNYCELTALYWIWRNDRESDVTGLCHYRRYFTKSVLRTDRRFFLSEGDIQSYLKNYDFIVPRKEYSYRGAYRAYLDCGYEKDLLLMREAVQKLYPEYLSSYDREFVKSSGNYPANMMIAEKKSFDAYCKWLFDILNYVEKRTDLTDYTAQEARIYGYLSERLLGVWLAANNLRVKTLRIINTEETHDFKFYIRELSKLAGLYQGMKKMVFMAINLLKG